MPTNQTFTLDDDLVGVCEREQQAKTPSARKAVKEAHVVEVAVDALFNPSMCARFQRRR